MNTAKYDESTLRGERGTIAKDRKNPKENKEAAAKAKNAVIVASNVNPTNITRLIRMFVIIALGAYKGLEARII